MKHNIVIAAGQQVFEFEGEILEFEDEHILLRAKRGDIYIERKYLVFLQALNEEVSEDTMDDTPDVIEEQAEPLPIVVRPPKVDQAARFIQQRLRKDPLNEKLEAKLVPPSQFPDDNNDYVNEDEEAAKNILGQLHPNHPAVKATNLRQAAKSIMANEREDFSMGMGNIEYKNPLQTILGMKNASNKKTRD
jgi:hypothetical protein